MTGHAACWSMRGASRREDSAAWVIRLDDAIDGVATKNGARFISLFTKPSRHTPTDIAPLEWEPDRAFAHLAGIAEKVRAAYLGE